MKPFVTTYMLYCIWDCIIVFDLYCSVMCQLIVVFFFGGGGVRYLITICEVFSELNREVRDTTVMNGKDNQCHSGSHAVAKRPLKLPRPNNQSPLESTMPLGFGIRGSLGVLMIFVVSPVTSQSIMNRFRRTNSSTIRVMQDMIGVLYWSFYSAARDVFSHLFRYWLWILVNCMWSVLYIIWCSVLAPWI